MENKITYSTFDAFRPHFDALAKVAYYKIVLKSLTPNRYKMHQAYRIVVWLLVSTYNLQHLIRVVQAQSTDQIVNTLFILLTTLNTLGKQLTFNVRSQRVDHIIEILNGPIFGAKNSYHVQVMQWNAVTMRRLLNFNIGCIFTCGTLWTVFPLVNRHWGGVEVEFTGYFPFNTSSSPAFELALAYMSILITFQAYGNVTMDATIVNFYAQVKVQLQMLRYDLKHLVDTADGSEAATFAEKNIGYIDSNKRIKELIQKRFVSCVLHHRQILWFIKEVESIFAEAMVFQLLVTAWVICMTVYKIVGLSLFSVEFVSMAMYLGCILAQLFMYCYYGTQVKYESEYVNQSAYFGSWLAVSPAFRRQMLVMMVNCSKPITPRSAYIIPISLETYIAILRSSYTLFTFLDRK